MKTAEGLMNVAIRRHLQMMLLDFYASSELVPWNFQFKLQP